MIDYGEHDWTALDSTWDVIFATVDESAFRHARGSLAQRGRFVTTTFSPRAVLVALWTRLRGGKRLVTGMSVERNESLRYVRELLDDGRLRVVVDRRYPLEGIVEAHRLVDTGHKRGNVIVDVARG